MMLADAVEAACRALRDPSISRLRNIVNSIVEERFKKGELEECPLTLRDLNLIKENFMRTLSGIFHGRIQYLEDQKNKNEKAKTGKPPSNKISPRGSRVTLRPNAKASETRSRRSGAKLGSEPAAPAAAPVGGRAPYSAPAPDEA